MPRVQPSHPCYHVAAQLKDMVINQNNKAKGGPWPNAPPQYAIAMHVVYYKKAVYIIHLIRTV